MSDQALEKVKSRMSELQIEPKRSLGQNFLISDLVIKKIIAAAGSFKASALIEIGPGLGALTDDLRNLSDKLTLIELDRKFAKYWTEQGYPVVEADALQFPWEKLPQIADTIIVSNLPYQISSSLLVDRSVDKHPFLGMVLMFQKEVAQRIQAKPSTSDYGLLSVIAQVAWEIQLVAEVSPQSFLPPPKVASRVLRFHSKSPPLTDMPQFLRFVKAAFSQRRKLLLKNILQQFGGDKTKAEKVFTAMHLLPTCRAEELSPQQFVDLYQSLR